MSVRKHIFLYSVYMIAHCLGSGSDWMNFSSQGHVVSGLESAFHPHQVNPDLVTYSDQGDPTGMDALGHVLEEMDQPGGLQISIPTGDRSLIVKDIGRYELLKVVADPSLGEITGIDFKLKCVEEDFKIHFALYEGEKEISMKTFSNPKGRVKTSFVGMTLPIKEQLKLQELRLIAFSEARRSLDVKVLLDNLIIRRLPLTEPAEGITTIYVSPTGAGSGEEKGSPARLENALQKVKEAQPSEQGAFKIQMAPGRYVLSEEMILSAGKNGLGRKKLKFTAAEKGQVTLSGGVEVTGWEKTEDTDLYRAPAPEGLRPRMLYKGVKSLVRARFPNTHKKGVFSFKTPPGESVQETDNGMRVEIGQQGRHLKLLDWKPLKDAVERSTQDSMSDQSDLEAAVAEGQAAFTDVDFRELYNTLASPQDLEFVMNNQHVDMMLHVDRVEREGNHQWLYLPPNKMQLNPNSHEVEGNVLGNAFHLQNAREFIDLEDEWCYHSKEHRLYLKSAEPPVGIFVPRLERLVELKGVKNIEFHGIIFEHGAYDIVNEVGFRHRIGGLAHHGYENRTEQYSRAQRKETNRQWHHHAPLSSLITLQNTENITFQDCVFRNTDGNALDLISGCFSITVEGSVFSNIGSTAILVQSSQDMVPKEKDAVRGISINNNIFTKMGNQFNQGMAIYAGFVSEMRVEHNLFKDSAGWAVNIGLGAVRDSKSLHSNTLRYNEFKNLASFCSDSGVFHTRSGPEQRTNTIVAENYLHSMDNSFYKKYYGTGPRLTVFYLDNASQGMVIRNNVLENFSGRYRPVSTGALKPSENNTYSEPARSREKLIIKKAGLTEKYKSLAEYN